MITRIQRNPSDELRWNLAAESQNPIKLVFRVRIVRTRETPRRRILGQCLFRRSSISPSIRFVRRVRRRIESRSEGLKQILVRHFLVLPDLALTFAADGANESHAPCQDLGRSQKVRQNSLFSSVYRDFPRSGYSLRIAIFVSFGIVFYPLV